MPVPTITPAVAASRAERPYEEVGHASSIAMLMQLSRDWLSTLFPYFFFEIVWIKSV
jgi:hypothetical protein